MVPISFLLLACVLALPFAAQAASPYAGETSRSIKALSDEEVAEYWHLRGYAGDGAGYRHVH